MTTHQKQILKSDGETVSPVINTSTSKTTFKKSRKRTSLNEFSIVNNLRPEVKAGFKDWLNGDEYHFDNEWKTLYEKYVNR